MIPVDARIGFGKRLLASTIDFVLMFVVALVIGFVGIGAFMSRMLLPGNSATGLFGAMAGILVTMVLVGVFYPLIEGFTGWSPAKRLLGLEIGTADGEVAPLQTLLTRYAVKNASMLVGFIGIITGISILGTAGSLLAVVVTVGCLMALMAPRQALHDRIAGTAVFKADAPREAAAMDETTEEAPAARLAAPPVATPARPRAAPPLAPGERRQCPKCGQSETELGSVIGWYCRICGWREARG